MPDSVTGIDLASQTGQQSIATAINNLGTILQQSFNSGSGISYPILDNIFDENLTDYYIGITHLITWEAIVPASNTIQQAINDYFTTNIVDKSTGATSGVTSYTLPISEARYLQLDNSTFESLWTRNYEGKEYKGYIYGTNIERSLSLTLLGDFSQGGNTSNNSLLDSIANYSGIILQGIYSKNRTSGYNSSFLYQDIDINEEYFAGMKDRNTSYRCLVTFTDNTTVSLSGNKQVIIYGIP